MVNGKQVIKLRLLYQPIVKNCILGGGDQPANGACYIIHQNGQKEIYSVIPEKLEAIHDFFKHYCPGAIQTFARMDKKSMDWQAHSMVSYYQKQRTNPTSFYSELHEKIIIGIESFVSKTNGKGINVIDGGCGDGKLLKMIESRWINNLTVPVKLVGFDFNPDNITDCLNNYYGKCNFLPGDLLKLDEVIAKAKALKWLNPDWPSVLILSGSLTRLVLKDGFQAGYVLMKAAISEVDYLIGGGVGEPLITSGMAKRLGYQENLSHPAADGHNFFAYQILPVAEIEKTKLAKLRRNNFLDLSLSPHPGNMLLTMQPYLREHTTIDLSFVPLTDKLIRTLNSIVSKNPSLKLIFWHPDEAAVKQFLKIFFLQAEVSVKIVSQDATLISSRRFFTQLQAREENDTEEELINDFIVEYASEQISSSHSDFKTTQLKGLQQAIANTRKRNIKIETSDDDQAILIIKPEDMEQFKHHLHQYIVSLERTFYSGDLSQLPMLVYWYKHGFSFRYPADYDIKIEPVGWLTDEIKIYSHLASKHANIFTTSAMKMLAHWAIHTKTKPHTPERSDAMTLLESFWPTNGLSIAPQAMAMGS